MTNFELNLINPSTIYEQERVNLWSEKVRLATDIAGLNMLSKDWVYENIFKLADGEQEVQRVKIINDIKDRFRYRSIEDQGNDPAMQNEPEDVEESLNQLKTELEANGKADDEFAEKLVTWADVIRKTFVEGGVDEVISTRRLVHISKTYGVFGNRMKAIELCLNRFDDDTKMSFLDLYSKVDAGANTETLMAQTVDIALPEQQPSGDIQI